MISSESRRDWMYRFGSRLMKLEPTLNAVTAARHAALAYEQHAGEAEPEEAAMMFATGKPGGDVMDTTAPAARNDLTVRRPHSG